MELGLQVDGNVWSEVLSVYLPSRLLTIVESAEETRRLFLKAEFDNKWFIQFQFVSVIQEMSEQLSQHLKMK